MKNQAYRMALLYDFYGDMLTDRQKEFYDLYYNEDLSLAEIAENYNITRQGVRDVIVRAEGILEELEEKTGIIRRFKKMQGQLEEIEKRIPGFPIVLHGSSSVPQEYVHIINTHGGALKDAIGIPEEQLRRAAKSAVCKINIDSDSRLAMTAAVRLVLTDKPAEFDPRKYLGPAREEMKKLYMHKCEKVLGSAGKA